MFNVNVWFTIRFTYYIRFVYVSVRLRDLYKVNKYLIEKITLNHHYLFRKFYFAFLTLLPLTMLEVSTKNFVPYMVTCTSRRGGGGDMTARKQT